ncbi:flagellar protein FlgN [Bdellovibrio sp. qaytius]|nr:flagellar protein FlgN [Bdellovibrio sp. qaytius]
MDVAHLKKLAYEKMIANLDDMLKNYRQLLDLVRKEKDLLITSNLELLNENNNSKEQAIIKIKALDAIRITYASELAHFVQADTAQPRLLEIAQKIGGAEGEKLRTMHAALEMVIKRLSEINKGNVQFAESALKSVNSALDNFKDALTGPQKTYQQKGKYKQASNSGNLVKREA